MDDGYLQKVKLELELEELLSELDFLKKGYEEVCDVLIHINEFLVYYKS